MILFPISLNIATAFITAQFAVACKSKEMVTVRWQNVIKIVCYT
jgi:hypothetical protein